MNKKEWNKLITTHGNGFRIINLNLLREFKDTETVLMLVELVDMYHYLSSLKKINHEFFFYVDRQIQEKLSIPKSKIPKIRKRLIEKGFIEYEGKGQPYKYWYKINFDNIYNFLSAEEISSVQYHDIDTSRVPNTDELDCGLVEQYIENKREEKEEKENEITINEKSSTENYYDETIELYDILFNEYPKSLEKDSCKNIFLKYSVDEQVLVSERIISIRDDLQQIKGNNTFIPTLKNYLLNELWKKSLSEWYPWDR